MFWDIYLHRLADLVNVPVGRDTGRKYYVGLDVGKVTISDPLIRGY